MKHSLRKEACSKSRSKDGCPVAVTQFSLHLLLVISADIFQDLEQVDLGPGSREGMVVEGVVEPTLHDLC